MNDVGLLAAQYMNGIQLKLLNGEIDFVVELDGHVVPIEVKSGKHYARHSALSRLMADPEYDFPQALVFNDKASKTEDRISYLPIYLLSFLKPTPLPEKMIFNI